MAYLFISDGGPDAEDFDNNYYEYDKSNHETLRHIRYIQDQYDTHNPNVRKELIAICKASFNQPRTQKSSKEFTGWYWKLFSLLKWRHGQSYTI